MALSSPTWSHLQIEWGIRLTIVPRPHKALLIETSLTVHGMKKTTGIFKHGRELVLKNYTTLLHEKNHSMLLKLPLIR